VGYDTSAGLPLPDEFKGDETRGELRLRKHVAASTPGG
jgi:hypothetical protein